ncbi:MAG: hypothetical protein QOG15_2156 [Solirubrobacteraceae bacterium]|jgi:hypothetical protein|nr:hypothetical protein [Solirubrobacteraceae bacterium]
MLKRAGAGALAALLLLGAAGAGSSTAQAAAPACFGAAERDPAHPCTNPALSVFPALKDRLQLTASGCRQTHQEPGPICAFGTRRPHPRGTFALLGDSHALHWRGPLASVGRAQRWRGLSVWSPLCLFSTAVKYQDGPLRDHCVRWNRDVLTWFAHHPEVSTVFISQAVFISIVPPPGRTVLATKADGFRRAWAKLPGTVQHVVVIRDVPGTANATFDCIDRVLAAGRQRAGPACREDRRAVLPWDPAIAAALRTRAKRVQSIDMTHYFCDRLFCPPVIGGVLVHRDLNHMTIAYAGTLGPYLLRAVRRLSASW